MSLLIAVEREQIQMDWAFADDPVRLGIAIGVFALGVLFVAANWWRAGRDRVYVANIHMSEDRRERTRPLLHRPTVVVEYTPPGGLRPAQIGVLVNERPGTREFTATYADLAARGNLSIEEIPRGGVDGRPAWAARRLRNNDELEPFEATMLDGLFANGDESVLAQADGDYWLTMRRAAAQLLEDAFDSGFFAAHVERVRMRWIYISTAVTLGGLFLVPILGALQLGYTGLAIAAIGPLIFATHTWMPRRTALGSEMLRRCLGFKMFVEQAEGARHAYNEEAGIFAKYLGYAIVFGVADKWANAFQYVNTTDIMRVYVPEPKRNTFADILSAFGSSPPS